LLVHNITFAPKVNKNHLKGGFEKKRGVFLYMKKKKMNRLQARAIEPAAVKALFAILFKKALDYAKNYLNKDARARGFWNGEIEVFPATEEEAKESHYRGWKNCRRVVIDPENPLIFTHESGTRYAFFGGISDGISAPAIAKKGLKKWADLESHGKFAIPAYAHDEINRLGGVNFQKPGEEGWTFMRVTNSIGALLMFQFCTAIEGATNAECSGIYAALKIFGKFSWNAHRKREARNG